jgi:hypothetical protein
MDDTPADRKALEDVQDQVAAQIASYLRVTQEARDRSRGVVLEDASGLQKQFGALLAIQRDLSEEHQTVAWVS